VPITTFAGFPFSLYRRPIEQFQFDELREKAKKNKKMDGKVFLWLKWHKTITIKADYTGGIEIKKDSCFPEGKEYIMNENRIQDSVFFLRYRRWGFSTSFLCSQTHM
jgi:hypothetical protein